MRIGFIVPGEERSQEWQSIWGMYQEVFPRRLCIAILADFTTIPKTINAVSEQSNYLLILISSIEASQEREKDFINLMARERRKDILESLPGPPPFIQICGNKLLSNWRARKIKQECLIFWNWLFQPRIRLRFIVQRQRESQPASHYLMTRSTAHEMLSFRMLSHSEMSRRCRFSPPVSSSYFEYYQLPLIFIIPFFRHFNNERQNQHFYLYFLWYEIAI